MRRRHSVRRDVIVIAAIVVFVSIASNVVGSFLTVTEARRSAVRDRRTAQDARASIAATVVLNDYSTCVRVNALNDRLLGIVDQSLARQKANAAVTLSATSKASTAMRLVAARNLVIASEQAVALHLSLPDEKCKVPRGVRPVPTTTTTAASASTTGAR